MDETLGTEPREEPQAPRFSAPPRPAAAPQPEAKAEFIAKANAICEEKGQQSAQLADEVFEMGEAPPSRARLRAFDRRSAALEREALAELRALEPPPGEEEAVTRVWDALERAIDELEALPPDEPGDANSSAGAALAEFEALASDFGLSSCAAT